jgi:hypothetical protein
MDSARQCRDLDRRISADSRGIRANRMGVVNSAGRRVVRSRVGRLRSPMDAASIMTE